MDEIIEAYPTWADVIASFFTKKIYAEEEKYIKELIKQVEADCKKKNYYNSELIRNHFGDEKLKREKEESSIDFQRRRIQALFDIKDALMGIDSVGEISELSRDSYEQKTKNIAEKYEASNWLEKASKVAASVSFATHVSKLTHSKIDSPSIFDQISAVKPEYVTTSALVKKEIDGAVTGNQFAPIFQLLELECHGVKLAAELANPNSEALKPFAQENEYLDWNKGFGEALTSGEPASHLLAKQVYFPLQHPNSGAEKYHLLCNVTSSSMAQAIFDRMFSEEVKQCQSSLQDRKFTRSENRYFPRRGKLGVTASNHSNASQLNGSRGGKLYLFASAPPTWKTQVTPPKNSIFKSHLRGFVSKNDLDYLREFLIRFDTIKLSIRHPERRKWIDSWVGRIVDDVLAYAANIQALEAGWSAAEDIHLKREHQLFLDPYRDDEAFQAERKANDWQATICVDFARWLNKELMGKEKLFSPQQEHTRMWIALIEGPLREYDELIRMEIKAGEANT